MILSLIKAIGSIFASKSKAVLQVTKRDDYSNAPIFEKASRVNYGSGIMNAYEIHRARRRTRRAKSPRRFRATRQPRQVCR